ncbi:metallophosphoesterase [Candidatus Bathyarchaeota archaeon]|nr:metallophosphoesterase [Candidatus Bathyarchaeota archaeon]
MIIGIISDTHDRIPFIIKAVEKLNAEKVDLVLHCGDYCAPFAVAPFKNLTAKMIGVYGNNDAEKELLRNAFLSIGKEVKGSFTKLDINGFKIAMLHGENEDLLDAIIECGFFNLVVYGHTHKVDISEVRKTLVVNPGEICGYLTGESSLALFNIEGKSVNIIKL